MLENILLYATYYEAITKFAENFMINGTRPAEEVALNVLNDFYNNAKDVPASKEEIRTVGKILYKNVMTSFASPSVKEEVIEELSSDLVDSILNDLDM